MTARACLIGLMLSFGCSATAAADALHSGVYEMGFEGPGRAVPRSDNSDGTVQLRDRLSDRLGKGTLVSRSNDNAMFTLKLEAAGPFPENASQKHFAVVIAGRCFPVWGNSDRRADGTMDLETTVAGQAVAKGVAAELGTEPRLRHHPGHKLVVTFEPEKKSYRSGEPVKLVMTIRNVGDRELRFNDGGSQRGPRNNQFSFTAFRNYGYGKALQDIGDPKNFGGLVGSPNVRPGATFTKKVELDRWFRFDEPDSYKVTAIYRLPITELDSSQPVIWDDFAVADCIVHVVK
jgi:hypothetical protein